jgi:NAD+ kinase
MRILLIANDSYRAATDAQYTVAAWLERNGIDVEATSSIDLTPNSPVSAALGTRMEDFGLVCVFGGDGTILRAAQVVGGSGVPLMGFNFGDLGFLAGATDDGLIPAVGAALAGDVVYERRTVLAATATFANGDRMEYRALNELVMGRSNSGHVTKIDLFINGAAFSPICGDGILVATATGSTAYALSAGGPLISPEHRGLVVVPIAPHTLTARAVVTAPSDIIELRPHTQADQEIALFIDGEHLALPGEVCDVRVSRSPDELVLVRYNAPDFYTAVSDVFFGGAHAR